MHHHDLKGRTALVTGAASGIGLAIARELASRGIHLILVDVNPAGLRSAATALRKEFRTHAETVVTDLSKENAAATLWKRFRKRPVEILVNNAGIFFWGEVASIEEARVRRMIRLHVLTPSLLCAYFGAAMRQRKSGFILNVASMVAYKDFPGLAHYGGTKNYMKSFTESLRSEMQEYGVSVTSLRPGGVETNLYQAKVSLPWARRLGFMLTPREVARAAVRGMLSGKAVVVPGFVTRLLVALVPLAPRFLIDFIKNHTRLIPR